MKDIVRCPATRVTVIGSHTVSKQTERDARAGWEGRGGQLHTVNRSGRSEGLKKEAKLAGSHLPHRNPSITLQSAILKQLYYQFQDLRMLALMIICIFLVQAPFQVQSHGPIGINPPTPGPYPGDGGQKFRARRSIHLPAIPVSTHAKKDVLPVQTDAQV
ncbi:hypothetical protein H4Q26_011095 [Puccinia striiformis f. sp. tritici PST-130]|uniref:Uncharacterized protein n=3 Tax=Puccinia striiformis TaxID=27350 RepID=A0A0L0VX67_9BASI|nr:hypothetical protein H4Q26_011095 [Puccinia striiformis f. sp. tritici PST-130]KNF03787.1 hypothetical protein PSTG_02882 [Puccinia striiformis f. sp. tritici PST-78]